jgi:hypothetical protein
MNKLGAFSMLNFITALRFPHFHQSGLTSKQHYRKALGFGAKHKVSFRLKINDTRQADPIARQI